MASELFFLFFDVQHGHATYIKTPNGRHWFIDIGQGSIQDSNATFSPLLYMKQRYRVHQLDYLVITHPHHDHIEDIGNISAVSPRTILVPRHLTEQEVRGGNRESEMVEVNQYLAMVKSFCGGVNDSENQQLEAANGGVCVSQFVPTTCARSNLNNHSVVTILSFAGTKVLIPGDNEAPSWRELLGIPAFVQAITGTDILLAAHHGREAGYCADIFDYFRPCLTVVSDAKGSDTSVVARYSGKSTGWDVRSRSTGTSEKRYCLTTGADKAVTVSLIKHDDGHQTRDVTVA